jgi:hypothetical protein
MHRIDVSGQNALVALPVPVNRFPHIVSELVNTVKASRPEMGNVRIAQILTRVGYASYHLPRVEW